MTMSQEISGGQSARQERYDAPVGSAYRSRTAQLDDGEQHNGAGAFETSEEKPRLPSLDLAVPPEPVFSSQVWVDGQGGTLADHPLLRGLLLELPPKGTTPPPGWLDRWFEATRSILELLYVDGAVR